MGGANSNKVSTLEYLMPIVSKAPYIKRAFSWRLFSEQLCSDLSRQIEIPFSLNWQVWNFVFSEVPRSYCTLDKKISFARNTFLQKRLLKYRYRKCKICSMPFASNLALEQKVFVAAIMLRFLYLHASVYTNTRSIEAEKQLCSKTLTSSRK